MSQLPFEDSPSSSLQANEFLQGLANAARNNPLPAALLGAGLIWILGRDIAARVGTGGKARGGKTKRARSLSTDTSDAASSNGLTGEKFVQGIHSFENWFVDLWEEQPLVIGGIGLAIGVGVASLLPATAVETDIPGPQAERIVEATKRVISKEPLE